jgi:hypothetical protein
MPSEDDFISGAPVFSADAPVLAARPKGHPWEAHGVRDDIPKVYNLRLPEPYLLKLKFIAEQTPDSMQKFCLGVLLPAIDAKIEELKTAGQRPR